MRYLRFGKFTGTCQDHKFIERTRIPICMEYHNYKQLYYTHTHRSSFEEIKSKEKTDMKDNVNRAVIRKRHEWTH